MPRAAVLGSPATIEAELTRADVALLDDWCRLLSVDRAGWTRVPMLRCFAFVAAKRLARRLRSESGMSAESAENTAALRIGIAPGTLKSWIYRSARTSRGLDATLHSAGGPGAEVRTDSTRTPTRRTA
jgi:hypothetical protein